MKLAPFRLGMTALTLLMAAGACTNTPTGLAPGEASFDNGGSYGSGGRTDASAAGDAWTIGSGGRADGANTDFAPCAEERNGGSYGSGGRSGADEECSGME